MKKGLKEKEGGRKGPGGGGVVVGEVPTLTTRVKGGTSKMVCILNLAGACM